MPVLSLRRIVPILLLVAALALGLDAGSFAIDEAIAGADVAVIVTAHPSVDHKAVAAAVPVVDLRGVTRTSISKTKSRPRGKAKAARQPQGV